MCNASPFGCVASVALFAAGLVALPAYGQFEPKPAGVVAESMTEGVCAPGWTPAFGAVPGAGAADTGTLVTVVEVEYLDLGTGPALYVGGFLNSFVNLTRPGLARYDGVQWSSVGSAVFGYFGAMDVFEHAPGIGRLYVAAWFFEPIFGVHVAVWNGVSWVSIGEANNLIEDLVVFDDGSGPALYAAGWFTMIGGIAASRIARWDGTSWSALGTGVAGSASPLRVRTLEVFDDGTGPALYAGGNFASAGGVADTKGIARWDGSGWSAVGSGVVGDVRIIKTLDLGGGPSLHAGGLFSTLGAVTASIVAVWDGSAWSPLPAGTASPSVIHDLDAFDKGAGPTLHAIGTFATPDGPVEGVARHDGTDWAMLGEVSGGATLGSSQEKRRIAAFEFADGPRLAVGGSFDTIGDIHVGGIASWDGAEFAGLGGTGVNGEVLSSAVFNDGSGDALYIGGLFTGIGELSAKGIARWDGVEWSALDGFPAEAFIAMQVFNDGAGEALYVSEKYALGSVSRWDGAELRAFSVAGFVNSFTVHDDGSGPALYAGGRFTAIDGVSTVSVARWDGVAWTAVNLDTGGGVTPEVRAMTVFDSGSGPALHALTSFGQIWRWDAGLGWSQPVGVLQGSPFPGTEFNSLVSFDDGSGPALYAGGMFTFASHNGQTVLNLRNIARWDGVKWERVGQGLEHVVTSLSVVDTGDSPTLFAGGQFGNGQTVEVKVVKRWDGSSWQSVDAVTNIISSSTRAGVNTVSAFDGGSGAALYFGGRFNDFPTGDSNLARYRVCLPDIPCPADLNGDAAVNGIDLLMVLNGFGPCPASPGDCATDLNDDGVVNGVDLLLVLNGFGACP